jgi:hypothetical protein
MTEDERHATFDECFEYNDHLRANGHLVAEVPLQPPETALTLHWKNGKVAPTDSPMRKPRNSLAAKYGHYSRISSQVERKSSAVQTCWRSAQSGADFSPREFPANRENNREFAKF